MNIEIKVYHATTFNIDKITLDHLDDKEGNHQHGLGFYMASKDSDTHIYSGVKKINNRAQYSDIEVGNTYKILINIDKKDIIDTTLSNEYMVPNYIIEKIIKSCSNMEEKLNNFGDVGYDGIGKVLREAVDTYEGLDFVNFMNCMSNDFFDDNSKLFLEKLSELTGKKLIKINNNGHTIYNAKNGSILTIEKNLNVSTEKKYQEEKNIKVELEKPKGVSKDLKI